MPSYHAGNFLKLFNLSLSKSFSLLSPYTLSPIRDENLETCVTSTTIFWTLSRSVYSFSFSSIIHSQLLVCRDLNGSPNYHYLRNMKLDKLSFERAIRSQKSTPPPCLGGSRGVRRGGGFRFFFYL